MSDDLFHALAPTADLPPHRGKDTPPAYLPCPTCSALVLRGVTSTGEVVLLDTGIPTWCVQWNPGAAQPELFRSRGYPVHQCVVLAPPPPLVHTQAHTPP